MPTTFRESAVKLKRLVSPSSLKLKLPGLSLAHHLCSLLCRRNWLGETLTGVLVLLSSQAFSQSLYSSTIGSGSQVATANPLTPAPSRGLIPNGSGGTRHNGARNSLTAESFLPQEPSSQSAASAIDWQSPEMQRLIQEAVKEELQRQELAKAQKELESAGDEGQAEKTGGEKKPTDAEKEAAKDSGKKTEEPKKPEEPKKKEWYEKIKLRGYTQFRYNVPTNLAIGSAPQNHAGDSSIGPNQEFLIRRTRLILYGDLSDNLSIYFQPDFASTPDGATNNIQFAQIRDWYADVHFDKTKVNRFRVGQSKIPYGWENMQSSSNRLYLDRNDAFNSAARNERDLGVFYYWTPEWAQEVFEYISDEGLKGSGNYGVWGTGVYNGQGGSLRELNDDLHLISRLALPYQMANGQIIEFDIQAYTGRYVVNGTGIQPLGIGPTVQPFGTRGRGGDEGILDQRLGWTFVVYPQPLGFQAEYTIGRGPELNPAQTAIETEFLHGGYAMVNYRIKTQDRGELWPFIRYQNYEGGYKNAVNAPATSVSEWNIGCEWQIKKDYELVCEYLITDRTNLAARSTGLSYQQFEGHVLRFQFQINY